VVGGVTAINMADTFRVENSRRNLISSGLRTVLANKRYVVWFWLLNLFLAILGTSAFRESSHKILDHSLYSEGLTQGFRLGVFLDLLARPEFGPTISVAAPALWLACVFFLLTALLLPGVFAGYASTYRLPREDFFRACGRNLWRFIRLMIIAGIVMGIVAGLLFAANGAIGTKAEESTNELLPFTLRMIGLLIIFLIMTTLRIWFDLAETDVVLNDQRAVRRSIAAGFRHTFRSLGRLLGSYVVGTVVAAIILVAGLWFWMQVIPADSVARAFLLIQFIMLLLLIPRFWQRGMAVSYWQERMLVPVVEIHSVEPTIVPLAPAPESAAAIPAEPAPTSEPPQNT
jgi:hypothetical protein